MRDEAHIGLVDAHAKGNRRHHHHAVVALEAVLVALPQGGVQAGVVGQGVQAALAQELRHFLDPLARLAIDDAGIGLMFVFDEAQQLRRRVLLADDGVADVGPVEAADKGTRILQLQALHDVGARQRIGGGREADARHVGEALVQHGQRAVFGAEVVSPLADAMHLVDGEHAQFAAFLQRIELGQKARRGHAFGRRVQERDLAPQHAPLDVRGLLHRQARIEQGRIDPGFEQRADLVVHQRDQRRDDQRHAVPRALARDGWNLKAQRFAAARGHQHQRIAA